MGALRDQMDKDMVLRGMSTRTRESYLYAVRGLTKHYRKSPDTLSEQDFQNYLLHLIEVRKLAWSSCNIVVQALKARVTSKAFRLIADDDEIYHPFHRRVV